MRRPCWSRPTAAARPRSPSPTSVPSTRCFEARQVEHAKLAKKLPEYFGPDVSAKTYDDLGNFLFAKGIPADRINAIHEAPIIELALAAMRFEQAQKQASTVTKPRCGEYHREDDTDPRRPRTGQSRRQPAERGGSASGRAVQAEVEGPRSPMRPSSSV